MRKVTRKFILIKAILNVKRILNDNFKIDLKTNKKWNNML